MVGRTPKQSLCLCVDREIDWPLPVAPFIGWASTMANLIIMFRLSFFIIPLLLIVFPVQAKVNLKVPFTSQAPDGNWSEPWQNACEEASIVMINNFYTDQNLSREKAKEEILHAFRIKESRFGISLDENAERMVNVINLFYPWEAYVVSNPSVEDIKKEIAYGRPIILPAYGSALKNPFFRSEQLDYHVLVISGYDDVTQEFITQDPGTRHGLDLRYSFDTIITAMHDFVPGRKNTKNGPKVAIFTRGELVDSGVTDGDEDGLIKRDELLHGTVLWLSDSDGDRFSDGIEVLHGYLPTLAEYTLPSGTLIKSASDSRVYMLEKTIFSHKKRHIVSEETFVRNGWGWGEIVTVGNTYLNGLRVGKDID
jgi:hypothetical protein